MHPFTKEVPKPSADSVNSGVSALRQKTMMEFFGPPALGNPKDCVSVTNVKLKKKISTMNVGPFRATGHVEALASLKRIFARVKAKDSELYALLGTAGMLCARMVRGSKTNWSNHSWGFAIDLTIGGELDDRGDDMVQVGLLRLYPYFHAEGWYWGVEFGIEDGMHFECSDELVRKWAHEGNL